MIYLDNSATTPLDPNVLEAMQTAPAGNASSIYLLGREAKIALEDARSVVARAIGADPAELVFTSGGSEANNHAVKGAIFGKVKKGKQIQEVSFLTSPAEHHAVLEPASFLESLGVKKYLAKVTEFGAVDPSMLSEYGNLDLASFMLVNNEVGTINPLKELSEILRTNSSRILIHSDAVQALGKIDVQVNELGVDLLSLSAHKIHGPKGIGALFIRRGITIEPLHHGGAQERNRRGGTEPVALAVGFAEAVKQMIRLKAETRKHLSAVRRYAVEKLSAIPAVIFNSAPGEQGVDGIMNISFSHGILSQLDAEALLISFDLEGIAVSNGSACTSGSIQPSHVLLAMGKGDEVASKSVRISFSRLTSFDDIDRFIAVLKKIIHS